MTTLKVNNRLDNGYMAFDYEAKHYNDFNEKGSDPNCKHETYTEKSSKWAVNKYCATCGYRRLFILYSQYRKK